MNTTTNTTVKTRAAAGADAVNTILTISWEGMTSDDVQALAQQALIVKLQSSWRKDGIPSGEVAIDATDFKIGNRAARKPGSIESKIAALTPDERAAMIARLIAMG